MKFSKLKFTAGFTMVEVLVVIAVIAILTVIVFPAINDIRKKNRDTERVSDLATIQLALSLFYNQNPNKGYPRSLNDLTPKYITSDSLLGPDGVTYTYIPLTLSSSVTDDTKCTYYHLGTTLELTSAQVDPNDSFTSYDLRNITGGYKYCGNFPPANGLASGSQNYNVRP